MQLEYLHHPHNRHDNGKAGEDRATAVLLTGGFNDGVPAFFLRHWRTGANPPEPVFVTWLLDVGRFCLTVKYGRYSLKGGQWQVDTGSGLRITPSPLEQARVEALSIREILQERLNRPLPVVPALALFDADPDRSIERLARRSRIPLLWDLEGCTGTTGRCRGRRSTPPAPGAVAGPGGDIGAHGGHRYGRRSPIPKAPDGLPVRIGVIGCTKSPQHWPVTGYTPAPDDRSGPIPADHWQPVRTPAAVPYWMSLGRRTTRSGFS